MSNQSQALSQALIESIAAGSTTTGQQVTRFDKIKEDTVAYVQVFLNGLQVHGAGGFNSLNIVEQEADSVIGRLLTAARDNADGKASYGSKLCYITLYLKGSKKPEEPVSDDVFAKGLFDPASLS